MLRYALILAGALAASANSLAAEPAPNGITMPEGYRNWPVLAVHYRPDNDTLRAVLGNDVAQKAVREGRTNPWPDGTTFAKLVWKAVKHDRWETAVIPGDFVHVEFMTKGAEKYASTGGWGYVRWVGMELKPYGKDANFVQECLGCHTPVQDRDYVFTHPVKVPE